MRSAVIVCLWASVANAQPSKVLERAIKLYDKTDYWSASIELSKVTGGETPDSEADKQRAQFYLVKTLYQMKYYAAAQGFLSRIQETGPDHPYFVESAKWALGIARSAPTASSRLALLPYRNGVIADPSLASSADEFAFELGRALAAQDDVPRDEAIAMLKRVPADSPFAPRAELEVARVELRRKDLDAGTAAAMLAATRDPALAGEAVRLIASWTHLLGAPDRARRPLGELARTSAYARYEQSRSALDDRLPFGGVAIEAFDPVMLASACRAPWPDDLKPLARDTIARTRETIAKLLAIEDNNELYVWIAKFRKTPAAPGVDVLTIALADPAMHDHFAELDEIDRELAELQRSDKAWQTSEIAADILQELTVQQSIEQGNTGLAARQRFDLMAHELDDLATALASLASTEPLFVGPDVDLGKGLIVTGALCGSATSGTSIAAPRAARATGCAGCASHDGSLGALLGLLALRRRPRPR